jgi:hypothetical protein
MRARGAARCAAIALVVGLGCGEPASSNVTRTGSPKPYGVPGIFESCETINTTTWTACDWLGTLDAVVIATVEAVQISNSPLAAHENATDSHVIVASCPGPTTPALMLRVQVTRVLKGSIPRGARIIRLGALAVSRLDPRPSPGDSGQVEWTAATVGSEGRSLLPGTRVVLPLRQFARYPGVWSLNTERMLGFDANGLVRAPPVLEPCNTDPPAGLTGITEAQLGSMLSSCPAPGPGSVRRDQLMRVDDPLWVHAAHCLTDVDPATPACHADLQCGEGYHCDPATGTCLAD